ncbi:MAG: SRPBCC family protein, partial [Actinomycetota bacterium]
MKPLQGSVTDRLSVPPDDLFDLISSVDRLPEWNEHIHHVVDAPTGPTREGDEWVVEIRVMGTRWNSRSRIEELDRDARRLSLVSQTDDGNPSYGRWKWQVMPVGGKAEITVSWELYPKTFWRRVLIARIRHRQLRDEVRSSLRAARRAAVERSIG